MRISHWDDAHGEWRQIDPPPDAGRARGRAPRDAEAAAEAEREARIETRTVAITSGKMVRSWFETTVADEARDARRRALDRRAPAPALDADRVHADRPDGKVEQVIADMNARAGATTRLETAYLTPL